MWNFLKPAPHKDLLPEGKIDSTYKSLRWQVFVGIFIGYVANDIGIGIVQFVCKSIAREQCQYCSQKVYIKSFHL